MKISIPSGSEMIRFGEKCGKLAEAGDLLVLTGRVGAGKTTFARGFGRGLGIETTVSSPTFVLARTHPRRDIREPPLVHLDAYRLKSAAELEDLDIDLANSIVIGEWASPFVHCLGSAWLELSIVRPETYLSQSSEDEPRVVSIISHGQSSNLYNRMVSATGDFHVFGD